MNAITRTQLVDGWTLGFAGDEEPRIRDLELAEKLGFARPRTIRQLIVRIFGETGVCRTVQQTPAGGRPAVEYWLTEAQALKVIAKSETKVADAILDEVIAVYLAWKHGAPIPPAQLDETASSSARARNNTQDVADIRFGIHAVHKLRGYTKQRIIGWIRKEWTVPSPYAVSTLSVPRVKRALERMAKGETSIGSKQEQKLLTAPKTKQTAFDWN